MKIYQNSTILPVGDIYESSPSAILPNYQKWNWHLHMKKEILRFLC